jgi:Tol biopolymer transport system component
MRTKNLIIGLVCLFVLVVVFSLTTKSQKPAEKEKPETTLIGTQGGAKGSPEGTGNIMLGHPPDTIRGYDIIDIGQGNTPRFSPDSKKIAFISGGWLCVKNSDGSGLVQKIAPISALDFQWMTDSSIIYWNQERYGTSKFTRSIKIVSLKGEEKPVIVGADESKEPVEPPIVLPDGTIGYYKHNLADKTQTFVVIKPGLLPPDSALKQLIPRIKFETTYVMYGDIWLVSLDGSYKRWVTFNKKFEFPELSPDGKKILAMKSPNGDPYLGGGPYLLDLKGHETYLGDPDVPPPTQGSTGSVPGHLIYSSVGYYAKFSPDGSKVVYMYGAMDTEKEDMVASDLVIKNIDGTGRFQIETPDMMEIYPVWSPDGKMIACQTDRINKIYVFKLK